MGDLQRTRNSVSAFRDYLLSHEKFHRKLIWAVFWLVSAAADWYQLFDLKLSNVFARSSKQQSLSVKTSCNVQHNLRTLMVLWSLLQQLLFSGYAIFDWLRNFTIVNGQKQTLRSMGAPKCIFLGHFIMLPAVKKRLQHTVIYRLLNGMTALCTMLSAVASSLSTNL